MAVRCMGEPMVGRSGSAVLCGVPLSLLPFRPPAHCSLLTTLMLKKRYPHLAFAHLASHHHHHLPHHPPGDLKPDNVLLTKDPTCPAGFVAKLTDFGLSASLDPGCTHVSNYKSGTPL